MARFQWDVQELAATVAASNPVVIEEVKAVLADSGFYSPVAVQAVEQKSDASPRAGLFRLLT